MSPKTDLQSTLNVRGARYGTFFDNSNLSQALKKEVNKALHQQDKDLPAVQREAITFIFQKISRIVNGDPTYVDNWHDIAGYATLVEQYLNQE